jgi:hypothetical protein
VRVKPESFAEDLAANRQRKVSDIYSLLRLMSIRKVGVSMTVEMRHFRNVRGGKRVVLNVISLNLRTLAVLFNDCTCFVSLCLCGDILIRPEARSEQLWALMVTSGI